MSERTKALLKKAFDAHLAGRLEAALAAYAGVLRLDPLDFNALQFAGLGCCQLGRLDEAIVHLRKAVRIKPKSGITLIYLGTAYADSGRDAEADESLRAGLALDRANPEAWLRVGLFNLSRSRAAEAMACFQQALKLSPTFAPAFKGMADVYQLECKAALAADCYRMALKLEPENTEARLGLVQTLLSCNRVAESLAECERVISSQPANIQAQSHRLFLLNYLTDLSNERLIAEHNRFGHQLSSAASAKLNNLGDPTKRIRIAFLSQDIRNHAVAFFLEPIVAHLDPAAFEVLLYHDNVRVDPVSERFRTYAAVWRNFSGRPDRIVESVIRADAPDVIVDLAGHSGQNRLHLFARRLAPVQITYLGYPNTTGLREMDYRFTDEVADPQGVADDLHVERLVRFSPCAWVFNPPGNAADSLDIPPAGEGQALCFGSFNNLVKVNDETLRLWSNVLAAVPGSRLALKAYGMDPGAILPRLAAAGIDPGRATLFKATPDAKSHMACYRNVDVALDTFPYGGTTTTCDALWMGRPVVTLAGDRHSSRVGASLLTAVGRPEWIARSPKEYVEIALGLASDRAHLRWVSAGLRDAMRSSPILDHRGQARRFGEAVRRCWTNWCGSGIGGSARLGADGAETSSLPELVHS